MGIKGINYGKKTEKSNNLKDKIRKAKDSEMAGRVAGGFTEGVLLTVGSVAAKTAINAAKKIIFKA